MRTDIPTIYFEADMRGEQTVKIGDSLQRVEKIHPYYRSIKVPEVESIDATLINVSGRNLKILDKSMTTDMTTGKQTAKVRDIYQNNNLTRGTKQMIKAQQQQSQFVSRQRNVQLSQVVPQQKNIQQSQVGPQRRNIRHIMSDILQEEDVDIT
jgi:hypothetical protein